MRAIIAFPMVGFGFCEWASFAGSMSVTGIIVTRRWDSRETRPLIARLDNYASPLSVLPLDAVSLG
jgi:hypothetical protein